MSAPVKGEKVKFKGGIYSGRLGWINDAKKATKFFVHVVVALDDGEEKATRVKKTSVTKLSEVRAPATYEDALLDQYPDVNKDFDRLAMKLVLCGIEHDKELGRLFEIFRYKIKEAQDKLDSKFREVDFPIAEVTSMNVVVPSGASTDDL